MFIFIYSLILYRCTRKSSKKSLVYNPNFLFGFEKGGNYSIKVENCQVDELLLVIATQAEMGKCKNEQLINHRCNAKMSVYDQMKIVNGSVEFTGSIKNKGVYMTKLISFKNTTTNIYNVIFNFKNPNSYLSYNYIQYLLISKIIAVISFLMSIAWFINWMFYCTSENYVHILLTLTLIFFAIEKISYALELEIKNKSDEESIIFKISLFAQNIKLYFFTEAIYLLETNISQILSLTKLFVPLYLVLLFIEFILFSQPPIIRNIVFCCFFIFYAVALFYMHKDYIPAPNEEHNRTRKPQTFLIFSFYFIIVSTFIIQISTFMIYFPVVLHACLDVSNIILMILFEYFYRLKSSNLKNYRFIDDKDEVISDIFEEEDKNQ